MDTVYRVVLSLASEGSLTAKVGELGAKAEDTHKAIHGLGEGAKFIGESFSELSFKVGDFLEGIADKAFSAAESVAKVGAAAVVGVATYGVAHLNNELEQTQVSLGAIAQAQGFTSTFEDGFKAAGEQVAKMKQDVKTLPGDLGQLSNMMK